VLVTSIGIGQLTLPVAQNLGAGAHCAEARIWVIVLHACDVVKVKRVRRARRWREESIVVGRVCWHNGRLGDNQKQTVSRLVQMEFELAEEVRSLRYESKMQLLRIR